MSDDLFHEHAAAEKAIEQKEEEIKEYIQDSFESIRRIVSDFKDEAEEEIKKLNSTIIDLESERDDLQEERDNLQSERDSLQKERDDLQEKKERLLESIEDLENRNVALVSEIDDLNDTIRSLVVS